MKKILSVLFVLMMLATTALADTAKEIGISNAPVIPDGTLKAQIITFTSNQTYAVYSAPDSKSIRGASNRARVSTNGWIQVFGYEGDWILVQYDITKDHNRIGYIYKNALPKDITVPDLELTHVPAIVNYDVVVTDDPLVSQTALAKLTENTKITALASMGDWTYIEGIEDGKVFRGFVPTESLSGTVTDLREARNAMVGSWKLYAGSSFNANKITFNADGTMTGRSLLESGREIEWSGNWSIEEYDTNRNRYWNDSEFELTLTRDTATEQYGLRICRQAVAEGQYQYALVISDGTRTSDMVVDQ